MTSLDTFAKAGIEAFNRRDVDGAIESFKKALAIDADRPDLNNAIGMAYLHRGEAISALPHLKRASELAEAFDAPEHLEMRKHFETGLATCYLVLDQIPSAISVLERACARWPHDLEVRTQHASALVSSCRVEEGRDAYRAIARDPGFDAEIHEVAEAIAGAIEAVLDDEQIDGSVFLQAHAEGYSSFFAEHGNRLVADGWYAEAQRLMRGPDGQPQPILAEGAKPWAVERIDLVNPETGETGQVGDEKDPHIVAVNGLEPLAQMPVALPWRGWPFEVWVCSRCPWHWLNITIQLENAAPDADRDAILDPLIGAWYLDGFNGTFGDPDRGRFHYATHPEFVGATAVAYCFDLGRARFEAIPSLLERLRELHQTTPVRRVVFGQARLPDVG